jgi:hypothetical protein
MNTKKCKFNSVVTIHETYSSDEYDRLPIDSILYLKSFNRVSVDEWNDIIKQLLYYKKYEMIVHISSLNQKFKF